MVSLDYPVYVSCVLRGTSRFLIKSSINYKKRSLSSDFTKIRGHIVQLYTQVYSEQFKRPKLDCLSFNSMGAYEGSWLEKEFEESE